MIALVVSLMGFTWRAMQRHCEGTAGYAYGYGPRTEAIPISYQSLTKFAELYGEGLRRMPNPFCAPLVQMQVGREAGFLGQERQDNSLCRSFALELTIGFLDGGNQNLVCHGLDHTAVAGNLVDLLLGIFLR